MAQPRAPTARTDASGAGKYPDSAFRQVMPEGRGDPQHEALEQTLRPCSEVTQELLARHSMSERALARSLGMDNSHLSRLLRGHDGRRFSAKTARAIGALFGLPEGYFPEEREAVAIEAVAAMVGDHAELRDELYRVVKARRPIRIAVVDDG